MKTIADIAFPNNRCFDPVGVLIDRLWDMGKQLAKRWDMSVPCFTVESFHKYTDRKGEERLAVVLVKSNHPFDVYYPQSITERFFPGQVWGEENA